MNEGIQAQEETQRYANTEGMGINYVAEKKAKRVSLGDTMVSVVGRLDCNRLGLLKPCLHCQAPTLTRTYD